MFFVGDKVKNSMREREGVVEGFKSDSLLLVNYGNGPEVTSLKNIILVKPVHTSLGSQLLAGAELPTLNESEASYYDELLHSWGLVDSVRVHAPSRIEKGVKEIFSRLGISYPPDWRGTKKGTRGGTEEQRTVASTVVLKDGRVFNSLGLTLRLLSDGQEFGWTVTKSA
jgi:hypothetical protein